jgi:hypothetical protein
VNVEQDDYLGIELFHTQLDFFYTYAEEDLNLFVKSDAGIL